MPLHSISIPHQNNLCIIACLCMYCIVGYYLKVIPIDFSFPLFTVALIVLADLYQLVVDTEEYLPFI